MAHNNPFWRKQLMTIMNFLNNKKGDYQLNKNSTNFNYFHWKLMAISCLQFHMILIRKSILEINGSQANSIKMILLIIFTQLFI